MDVTDATVTSANQMEPNEVKLDRDHHVSKLQWMNRLLEVKNDLQ
jgi:hypothetical protein